jgi:hypothetical protein
MGRGGSQRARLQELFAQVTSIDFAEFADRESAELEESRQLRLLQPAGNKHRHALPFRYSYRALRAPAAQDTLL